MGGCVCGCDAPVAEAGGAAAAPLSPADKLARQRTSPFSSHTTVSGLMAVSEVMGTPRLITSLRSHGPSPRFWPTIKFVSSITQANSIGVSHTALENIPAPMTIFSSLVSGEQTISRLLTTQRKQRSSGDHGPAWTSKSSFHPRTPCVSSMICCFVPVAVSPRNKARPRSSAVAT